MDDFDRLLSLGKLIALEHSLEEGEVSESRRVALRAELATRGRGPVTDVVLAVEGLQAEDPALARRCGAEAARQLHRAGARRSAQDLLTRSRERWPDDEGLALAEEQLRVGPARGSSRQEWEALRLLEAGRWDEARLALETLGSEGSETEQRAALMLLYRLDLGRGDFAAAAVRRARLAGLQPESDDAVHHALSEALARWAAGEAAGLEGLRALRDRLAETDDVHEETAVEHGYVRAVSSAVVRTLEQREDAKGPEWVFASSVQQGGAPCRLSEGSSGVALAAHVLRGFGLDEAAEALSESLPTLPHLRQALERGGLTTLRVILSEAHVKTALDVGAQVILEEELAAEAGFLLLEGYEPIARLFLVLFAPRVGPGLIDVDTQFARCALSGRSALIVTGLGEDGAARAAELEALGMRHEARLEALDSCHIDAEGRVPPRMRITELAARALDVTGDIPLTWARLGESLLARMRGFDLDPNGDAEGVLRWYADVRERFPEAEWPLQTYAQLMELQERHAEAGIAWADAAARDPYDARNFCGLGKAIAHLGEFTDARVHLRRALALDPRDPGSLATFSRIVLADEGAAGASEAGLLADLAMDMAPGDTGVLVANANVAEQRDDFASAQALLEQVAQLEPSNGYVRLRLLRRSVHAGQWQAAWNRLQQVLSVAPGSSVTWIAVAETALAVGEGHAALDYALAGLQRCGPEARLVSTAIEVAAHVLPREELRQIMEVVLSLSGGLGRVVVQIAATLDQLGLPEEAEDLVRQAMEGAPQVASLAWYLARLLLRQDREKAADEARALFAKVSAESPSASLPPLMVAWLELERDPEAVLTALNAPALAGMPAFTWPLAARALEATAQLEPAAQLRTRLAELYPTGVCEPAEVLRSAGFADAALEILEGAAQAYPDNVTLLVERATTLRKLARPADALACLLRAEELEVDDVPRWLLVETAHAAGDWKVLARVAQEHVDYALRESTTTGYVDTWISRARHAGAALALKDPAPREALLAVVGAHPKALATLCSIELAIGDPEGVVRRDALAEEIPGALRAVERDLQ